MSNYVRGLKRQQIINRWLQGHDDPDFEVFPTKKEGKFIVKKRAEPLEQTNDEEQQEEHEEEQDDQHEEEQNEEEVKPKSNPKSKPAVVIVRDITVSLLSRFRYHICYFHTHFHSFSNVALIQNSCDYVIHSLSFRALIKSCTSFQFTHSIITLHFICSILKLWIL